MDVRVLEECINKLKYFNTEIIKSIESITEFGELIEEFGEYSGI